MKRNKNFKKILIIVLVVIILGGIIGGGIYYYQAQKAKKQTGNIVATKQEVKPETTNFQTYTDTEYGFSFQYPSNTAVNNDTNNTGLLIVSDAISGYGMYVVDAKKASKSLEDYTNDAINGWVGGMRPSGVPIARSEVNVADITVGGQPAKKVWVDVIGDRGNELVFVVYKNSNGDNVSLMIKGDTHYTDFNTTFLSSFKFTQTSQESTSADNSCINGFQKELVTKQGNVSKYTLTDEELNGYDKVMGIKSLCVSKEIGAPFLNVDWDSAKQPDYVVGRKLNIGFKNFFNEETGGWGGLFMEYSTYNFTYGTEYYTYATLSDYQNLPLLAGKKDNTLEVDGVKGISKYQYKQACMSCIDDFYIEKVVVFPFPDHYFAIVYDLSGSYKTQDNQVIQNLYNGTYPENEKNNLKAVDDFISKIKFEKL